MIASSYDCSATIDARAVSPRRGSVAMPRGASARVPEPSGPPEYSSTFPRHRLWSGSGPVTGPHSSPLMELGGSGLPPRCS